MKTKTYLWQKRRKRQADRLERIKMLKSEIARRHSLIGRLDPRGDHKTICQLNRQLSTLSQRLRYISSFEF